MANASEPMGHNLYEVLLLMFTLVLTNAGSATRKLTLALRITPA
jgi:hypothetical protein